MNPSPPRGPVAFLRHLEPNSPAALKIWGSRFPHHSSFQIRVRPFPFRQPPSAHTAHTYPLSLPQTITNTRLLRRADFSYRVRATEDGYRAENEFKLKAKALPQNECVGYFPPQELCQRWASLTSPHILPRPLSPSPPLGLPPLPPWLPPDTQNTSGFLPQSRSLPLSLGPHLLPSRVPARCSHSSEVEARPPHKEGAPVIFSKALFCPSHHTVRTERLLP